MNIVRFPVNSKPVSCSLYPFSAKWSRMEKRNTRNPLKKTYCVSSLCGFRSHRACVPVCVCVLKIEWLVVTFQSPIKIINSIQFSSALLVIDELQENTLMRNKIIGWQPAPACGWELYWSGNSIFMIWTELLQCFPWHYRKFNAR